MKYLSYMFYWLLVFHKLESQIETDLNQVKRLSSLFIKSLNFC